MANEVFGELVARSGIAADSLDERLALEGFERILVAAIGPLEAPKNDVGNGETP